jgi:amylosucrase
MSSIETVLSHIEKELVVGNGSADWQAFKQRVHVHGPHLHALLYSIYGKRDDFAHHFEGILLVAAKSWLARAPALKKMDAEREANPRWFQSNQMLGGIAYVDLYASNLEGIRAKLPYFKELGLTYLHLMPLFEAPEGNSDGGYAVSSYRAVNPKLGNMSQLIALASELRENGISLCVDFIFNHTSDEHEWAKKAIAGDPKHREFYLIMPRAEADEYDKNLREIFPDQHPGAFTALSRWQPSPVLTGEGRGGGFTDDLWVWTTFNSFQWDLNYANPAVFTAMASEMLFIANVGVDVVRMDAVAFIWKQLGTGCENLPEAHLLIQAFNAVARIAAPSLIFKSEAIVHPNDVAKYIRPDECQISYNPLLMALLWNTLATREVNLLSQAIAQHSRIHADCAWVNYVRCHDDIGWTFSDEDAWQFYINGFDHRQFLNRFYTSRFDGTFARGLPFQENPKTGDCRISGMTASLAGLEKAMTEHNEFEIDLAIRRILLIHGIAMSYGGIPLIYLNDEIGALNDYSFRDDPAKVGDSRWVHRPAANWLNYDLRHTNGHSPSIQARIYKTLRHMIEVRKSQPVLATSLEGVRTDNPHVLGFAHFHDSGPLLVLGNFSERPQTIATEVLHTQGFSWPAVDLISDSRQALSEGVTLSPYQLAWLRPT